MAFKGRQVAVGTSATLLTTAPTDSQSGQSIAVKNKTGAAASVFLGDAAVTASGGTIGYELEVGEGWSADLQPGEAVYAIVLAGSVTVHVSETGV